MSQTWRGGGEMSPKSASEDVPVLRLSPALTRGGGGGKSKQPNQPTQKTLQPTPPLQPRARFLYFSCLLGELACTHRATWVYATSSGCTLVLQLEMEPGVVEQTVPARL